jgi:hypothetical protein
MFGNYRVNLAIDTPWDQSFSDNYCMKGIETDATFGSQFPGRMGGTIAFGKLAAIAQCAALSPFNWSLLPPTSVGSQRRAERGRDLRISRGRKVLIASTP